MEIAQLEKSSLSDLQHILQSFDFSRDVAYFAQCLNDDSQRVVLCARDEGQSIAICVVNFAPTYPLFKRLGIPEIQDLNVARSARRHGVGTAMMRAAEDLVRDRGFSQVGIGVGLGASYGPAQRLYVRLGYIPDGAGVSYDSAPVAACAMRPIDDLLCLMMVKDLE